jgi:predicted MPP superfamily phosphohydrolase
MRYSYDSAQKQGRKKRRHRWPLIAGLLVLLLFVLLLDSRYRLVTSRYELSFASLPQGFDGFRIVSLSDLHGAEFGEENRRLVEKVLALEPDVVFLTGDFVDRNTEKLDSITALCKQLTEKVPVYFVSGNHDWGSGRIQEIEAVLETSGVTYLRNSYTLLTHDDDQIVLAGVEDPNSWAEMTQPDELVAEIRAEMPDAFVILLGHRNYWPELYPDLAVDLIFAGHAHGGIMRLPGIGGLLGTDHKFFPKNVDGVVYSGNYAMVVSRGLGNSVAIPRFLNNPELILVTLHSSSENLED